MKVLVAIICRMPSAPSIETIEAVTFWPAWQEIAEARLFPLFQHETSLGRAGMNQLFLRHVREWQPDLVFSVAFRNNWESGIMEQVDCPAVVWFSDSYRADFVRQQAAKFDIAIVMDDIGEKLLAGHPNVKRSMWACNPSLHCPGTQERDLDVVFIGGTHGGKESYLQALCDVGLSTAVHGLGRKSGRVATAEYVNYYQRAKIGLVFTMSADGRTPQPKARMFETPAMGALLLAQRSPYLDSYLKLGKEYDDFNSAGELVDKVQYYLEHERKRIAIARAGCKSVRRKHTYIKRLREVVQWVIESV